MDNKAKKVCGICTVAESKYKCPNCTIPYCSLVCYKKHKETPCDKPAPIPEPETITVPPPAPKPEHDFDEPVAALSDEQLQRIAKSQKVKEMLQDDRLRRLIKMIDSSENPEFLLDKARKDDQRFMEFSEEILAVVGAEGGQKDAEKIAEALLERKP